MDEDEGEDGGDWEESVSFVGPCTCDHEQDEHTWVSCGVEGCDCEAAFEE